MESSVISVHALGFQWETKDPFLFCAHHNDAYPEGNEALGPAASLKGRNIGSDFDPRNDWRMYHGQTVPGFPVHPHRGFETITIVLSGFIDHADSAGSAGRYGNGDVQWMTAGAGLQHAEMFPLLNKDKPNPLELFQIWLNLPGVGKMVKPYFKMLWKESIPRISVVDSKGRNTEVIVITGRINDVTFDAPAPDSWAANPLNEVIAVRLKMEPNAEYRIPSASKGVNRMLYYYLGSEIDLNGEAILANHSIELKPDFEIIIKNGYKESELLLLQGKPINEPVVQYGPFVMNTQQEIQKAVSDYRLTEFGGWPWPSEEQVHGKEKSRFARYSDGTYEYPE